MRGKASHIARARHREDVALKMITEGSSRQDIADRLSLPPATISGLLQRARSRARAQNAKGLHGADCPCDHPSGTKGACGACNCADFSAEEIAEMVEDPTFLPSRLNGGRSKRTSGCTHVDTDRTTGFTNPDGTHSGLVEICNACGAWLSLGPSNDDHDGALVFAISTEIRAAWIAQAIKSVDPRGIRKVGLSPQEKIGWERYAVDTLPLVARHGNHLAAYEQQVGWLARAIVEHVDDPVGDDASPTTPIDATALLPLVPCEFCANKVTADNYCSGCKVVVCDQCEADPANAPLGPHQPEDHRRSEAA